MKPPDLVCDTCQNALVCDDNDIPCENKSKNLAAIQEWERMLAYYLRAQFPSSFDDKLFGEKISLQVAEAVYRFLGMEE